MTSQKRTPCACNARQPHVDATACFARLLRDREALIAVVDRLGEQRPIRVARVEIDVPQEGRLLLHVTTSRAIGDEDLAGLIATQLGAAMEFGRSRPKTPAAPAAIAEVYERFRHLDVLLSEPGLESDDPMARTARALWAGVKEAAHG